VSDEEVGEAPFYKPPEDSQEMRYLMERREALGGFTPTRKHTFVSVTPPEEDLFDEFYRGTEGRDVSTTMAFVRILSKMLKDKNMGRYVVPIVPDEARTFGMEALFRTVGIYASRGQLYEPVDSHLLLKYEERKNGQILEEGITEAGSMASYIAAGTAYANHGVNTIPFYIYYSMFGFQRVGDQIWCAADARTRGFLVGGTAGRTTLNGEGLQHEDGHNLLHASTVPNCLSYDCAWAYELAIVIKDGIKRMYQDGEDIFYYLTVYNENYEQPPMPEGVDEGVLRGLYKYKPAEKPGKKPRVHLFGSGPILRSALEAQEILLGEFGVAADVWSVPSYTQLYRDALDCERWNRLHPGEAPKKPYVVEQLEKEKWPIVATSDYMKAVPERLSRWIGHHGFCALGTDGFGRSETRENLRRHFEIDAQCTAYAALYELAQQDKFDRKQLPDALKKLGIDPEKLNPHYA
jgi:pyruvate dehydrogenase E1 component